MNKTYKELAFSNDDSSFDPENVKNKANRENGLGLTPKVLEKGDGFVKVYADSAQTTLKIPFGWYGMDTGQKTLFYSPDGQISLSLSSVDGGGADFLSLKKQVIEEYKGYESSGAQIENTDLPDGSFLSKALGVNQNGEKLSMVSVYTPNPQNSQYYWKLLMSAPTGEFEKYYDLIGLILRDREIKQNEKADSMESYLDTEEDTAEYGTFADKVIAELGKGNTQHLKDNLSPNLITANGEENIDNIFLPAAKKLFANFSHIGNSVTIQPSTDSYGNSGFSFARSIVYKDKSEKNFKIYVIKENEKLVVGNIVD